MIMHLAVSPMPMGQTPGFLSRAMSHKWGNTCWVKEFSAKSLCCQSEGEAELR